PGSNSRLNLLFWMANLMADRSPQFELKLLTNFYFSPCALTLLHASATVRIQPDCQTSAHGTRDFSKANTLPASKAVRPQLNSPRTKIQPVAGRFDYNQKLGNLKELLQKGGLSGLQSGKTSLLQSFLYRVLLPTLP
ncbi:MAG: hypothetical protein ABSF12_14600, partial [Bryobacteraceae bacterium]